jgi:hypothetical protein
MHESHYCGGPAAAGSDPGRMTIATDDIAGGGWHARARAAPRRRWRVARPRAAARAPIARVAAPRGRGLGAEQARMH